MLHYCCVFGNIRVSKEKRERILAIAKEMDYIPNISARMLAGISSHTLGILVDSEVGRGTTMTVVF